MSCTKAQDVLVREQIAVDVIVDARKEVLHAEETWKLLQTAEELIIAKGKKIVRLVTKEVGKEEVLAQVLGRSGTLRAPTLRVGSRFFVGWGEALFQEFCTGIQKE